MYDVLSYKKLTMIHIAHKFLRYLRASLLKYGAKFKKIPKIYDQKYIK